jgi:hypothetical protein
MQQAELQIKGQEAQRKAQKDQADAAIAAEKLRLDQERIESAERIAGAKIMAEMEAKEKEISIKRAGELLRAGTKLMGGNNQTPQGGE